MNRTTRTAIAAAVSLVFASAAMAGTMSKADYKASKDNIEAEYKSAKAACDALKDNAKDICIAEAKGRENIAKADAEAMYENTPKAREHARVVHAQAGYDVAIEKCDDLAGNPKAVCVKEAKAALVKGKANAKVDRVAADTNKEAATKQADARTEASTDKRDAEFKVAIEKCDALAGTTKDVCVSNAKAQYGKS